MEMLPVLTTEYFIKKVKNKKYVEHEIVCERRTYLPKQETI